MYNEHAEADSKVEKHFIAHKREKDGEIQNL